MAITADSIVKVSGAPSAGEQVMTDATDLTEFNDTLEEAMADTITPVEPASLDLIPFVQEDTGTVKWGRLNQFLVAGIVDASISGTGLAVLSSATPTALPIFDTDFYSSVGPAITATAGDLGLTVNIPARFTRRYTIINS